MLYYYESGCIYPKAQRGGGRTVWDCCGQQLPCLGGGPDVERPKGPRRVRRLRSLREARHEPQRPEGRTPCGSPRPGSREVG